MRLVYQRLMARPVEPTFWKMKGWQNRTLRSPTIGSITLCLNTCHCRGGANRALRRIATVV